MDKLVIAMYWLRPIQLREVFNYCTVIQAVCHPFYNSGNFRQTYIAGNCNKRIYIEYSLRYLVKLRTTTLSLFTDVYCY